MTLKRFVIAVLTAVLTAACVRAEDVLERIEMAVGSKVCVAGDTISFECEVLQYYDSAEVGGRSNYVYVALVNPLGETVKTAKIKRTDSGFAGYMSIEPSAPEGVYTLAAYTMFMRNYGQESFAKIPIQVISRYCFKETHAKNDIKAPITENEWPIEEGMVLSGRVTLDPQGNKPVKGGEIHAIVPAINWAKSCRTDDNGYFDFDYIEWPEGTSFVFNVKNAKGKTIYNPHLIFDDVPEIEPIQSPAMIQQSEHDSIMQAKGIVLKQIDVVAPLTEEEIRRKAFSALGIRIFGEDEFKSKAISSYEGAIRDIPGVMVSGSRVVSSRPGGITQGNSEVEIWVDNVPLQGSAVAKARAKRNTVPNHAELQSVSRILGVSRADAALVNAMAQNTDLDPMQKEAGTASLDELSAAYPFSNVERIEYFPPNVALSFSSSAAYSGGVLHVITKKGAGKTQSIQSSITIAEPQGLQIWRK